MPNVYSLDSLLVAVASTALVIGGICTRLARGPKQPKANRRRPRTPSRFAPTVLPHDAWRTSAAGWRSSTRVVATARVRRSSRVDVLDVPIGADLMHTPAPLYEQMVTEHWRHQAGMRP